MSPKPASSFGFRTQVSLEARENSSSVDTKNPTISNSKKRKRNTGPATPTKNRSYTPIPRRDISNAPLLRKIKGFCNPTTGSIDMVPETIIVSSDSDSESSFPTNSTEEREGVSERRSIPRGEEDLARGGDPSEVRGETRDKRFSSSRRADTIPQCRAETSPGEVPDMSFPPTASRLVREGTPLVGGREELTEGDKQRIPGGEATDNRTWETVARNLDESTVRRTGESPYAGNRAARNGALQLEGSPSKIVPSPSPGASGQLLRIQTRVSEGSDRRSIINTIESAEHQGYRRNTTIAPPQPLPLVALPRHNPFLRSYPSEEDEPPNLDDDFYSHSNDLVQRDTPQLVTAQESGFFDTTVETGHEANAVRIAAGAVYFRWHVIDENDVRTLLIADRIHTRSPLYQVIRQNCMRHQTVYQSKAMKWYRQGVSTTVDAMGGMHVFTNATSSERQAVWRAMFDKDPLAVAMASMPSAHLSVDLRGIYNSTDPRGHQWRRFIKTCFVWMAEDTFVYRLMENDDEAAFTNWKAMPRRRALSALKLGGTLSVPVRHGGMYDRDRREIQSVPMNNATYVLEDD